MDKNIENTAKDYSKFAMIDMNTKLDPVKKSVDGMLARLEEFQTMLSFDKQERITATSELNSLLESKDELYALFKRIDAVECLVEHAKSTLDALENDIEKAEEAVYPENKSPTTKITHMLTPLFKKSPEKSSTTGASETFKTEDYFH